MTGARGAAIHSEMTPHDFQVAKFHADSALLRELGERLVGQPHVALAELIKNAYDADATVCTVSIANDEITVTDNGHGMTEAEFVKYWMTIGTRSKQVRHTSPKLRRTVTGAKGVGRLSAQFLAHNVEIATSTASDRCRQLRAMVNWDDAAEASSLTEAEARYKIEPRESSFPEQAPHGTRVTLTGLKQRWDVETTRGLGRQLWMLQPPLSRFGLITHAPGQDDFRIVLTSTITAVKDTFDQQMQAMLRNHAAEISGELTRDGDKAIAQVMVTFRSGERYSERFDVEPLVASAKWVIRIFKLSGRQPDGIDVAAARDYFARFGGVMIYDAGFRLPYYGAEQDWLGIEVDQSHRKSRSALLPGRLQIPRALAELPTQGRLFGVVSINTTLEAREATEEQKERGEFLKAPVTRDRLVSNGAYRELRRAVRWSLDYYATRQRLKEQRTFAASPQGEQLAAKKVDRVRTLLIEAHESHPRDETIAALRKEVDGLSGALSRERRADERARMLLGPLAAAGMAALALEHESRNEMRSARQMLSRLIRLGDTADAPRVVEVGQQIGSWVDRMEDARKLFAPLLDLDDREEVEALSARPVLREVIANVRRLVSGMEVSLSIPSELYLPPATFAEWNSLFQNVIFNASNATLDVARRRVLCSGGRNGRRTWIRVEDNGVGVDYADSAGLFEPFARQINVSEGRRALGLGGMGLGLTIVRMIASQRRARVAFVKPSSGWATAFQLSWSSPK